MTGFVLSLTCCLSLVGAILGLVGLGRTRPGRHSGRWAAVSAIAVGSTLTVLAVAFVTWAVVTDEPIDELQAGDCFDAAGLQDERDDGSADVSDVVETSCQDPHDAQVLTASELNDGQAELFERDALAVCEDLVSSPYDLDRVRDAGTLVPILDSVQASAGDLVVCVLTSSSGAPLTEVLDLDE